VIFPRRRSIALIVARKEPRPKPDSRRFLCGIALAYAADPPPEQSYDDDEHAAALTEKIGKEIREEHD
jgi:hypothetical protein